MARNAVLIIADDKQFPPAVFLASRIARLKSRRDVDIVLASDSPKAVAEARAFGVPFELLPIGDLYADLDLPLPNYFTRATYYSLFVPRLLQGRYDRLLYIDVDTYPESDRLFAAFDLDMAGHAIGAIRDLHIPFVPMPWNSEELLDTLKIAPDQRLGAKYLNSGVLLIDLEAFRTQRIEKQALRLIRDKRVELRWPDQTVFNAVLRMRWLELSPAFNMVTRAWASFIRQYVPPVIVHFTGPVKPWHRAFVDDHPVRRELPAFLKETPWATFIADINPPPQLVSVSDLPRPPEPQKPVWYGAPLAALVRYLRETPFADVEQGITVPNPAALPKAG
jgi:lipopolysaccharide biosynthesis glycosyltransferase